jgi:hypothetical protein
MPAPSSTPHCVRHSHPRSSRLAWRQRPARAKQHLSPAVAAACARAQQPRKYLADRMFVSGWRQRWLVDTMRRARVASGWPTPSLTHRGRSMQETSRVFIGLHCALASGKAIRAAVAAVWQRACLWRLALCSNPDAPAVRREAEEDRVGDRQSGCPMVYWSICASGR